MLYCHAGCSIEQICAALAIPVASLYYDWNGNYNRYDKDLSLRFADLQRRIRGHDKLWPIERFDDVLWITYPTSVYRLCWVAVKWDPALSYSWSQAQDEWVWIANGPVFDYLRPQWEAEGQPNLHDFKRKVLHDLQSTWRQHRNPMLV